MNRSDIVGHTITALLRDKMSFCHGKPVAGVSTGEMWFYNLFFELDGTKLVYIGTHRTSDPLEYVPIEMKTDLVELDLEEGVVTCVGEKIEEVLVAYGSVFVYLSSGRYLWVDEDLEGTEFYLETEKYFTCRGADSALKMFTYWGGEATDHGGGRFLDE